MKIPDSWMQTGPYAINALIIDANISGKTGLTNFFRMTHRWFFHEEHVDQRAVVYHARRDGAPMTDDDLRLGIRKVLVNGEKLTSEEIADRLRQYGIHICSWIQTPLHGRIARIRFVGALKPLVDSGEVRVFKAQDPFEQSYFQIVEEDRQ